MIPSDTIHLWFCTLHKTIDPALRERYENIISSDETERMERFRFEQHRLIFLIAHVFLREVLSRYMDCSPSSITYRLNPYGKPSLCLSADESGVSFNLSHTDGLVCCAVVKEGDIGVDVESTKQSVSGDEIGERFFSTSESAEMMELESEDVRNERFCRLWVLKEAYIKAKGMGLSLPLDLFSFHFLDEKKIDVKFDAELQESVDNWHFFLLKPTEQHRAAVAYKSIYPNRQVSLKIFQTAPLSVERVIVLPLLGTCEPHR